MSGVKKIINAIDKVKPSKKTFSDTCVLDILKAVKKVTNNNTSINSLIFLQTTLNPEISLKANSLTIREHQILYLIGIGKQSSKIAKQLELRITTIETHRKNIRKKLALVGKGKLIEFAILNNLIKIKTIIK